MFYRKVKIIAYENTIILYMNLNIMKMQIVNKSKTLVVYVVHFV